MRPRSLVKQEDGSWKALTEEETRYNYAVLLMIRKEVGDRYDLDQHAQFSRNAITICMNMLAKTEPMATCVGHHPGGKQRSAEGAESSNGRRDVAEVSRARVFSILGPLRGWRL